jgi:hypothetical protein
LRYSCGHVSTKKNVRGIKDAATSTPPQLCSSRYIRYRDNIGYPRYGERYDIGDNQYSSNNLSYCPINRFLESISNLSPAAACKRLTQRAEIYCSTYEQLLASTDALLDRASTGELTQEQLGEKMLEFFVSKECMRGFDITANFVAEEVKTMSITLQVPRDAEEYDVIIQSFREQFAAAREEIRSRRNLLGPITLIQLQGLHMPAIPPRDKILVLGR